MKRKVMRSSMLTHLSSPGLGISHRSKRRDPGNEVGVTGGLQNNRFRLFRKARSAVSVILECEVREPHTAAGRVSPILVPIALFSSLSNSPSPFLHSLQTFRSSKMTVLVARVRKKYDCFAV